MWSLLLRAAKDKETGIVLLREELERGGVIEWVNGVLLGELLGERNTEGVELVEGILDDLGAGGAAEKEAGLGVFDGFGLALLEGPLGASIARFSNSILADVRYRHVFDYCRVSHLSEHLDFGYRNMLGFTWS